MRVLTTKLRVEIENEMRVFLKSLNFEIEMRVSQKSGVNEESLILRFEGQVSSRFKLKWVEEVKLYRKSVFDDCSIA